MINTTGTLTGVQNQLNSSNQYRDEKFEDLNNKVNELKSVVDMFELKLSEKDQQYSFIESKFYDSENLIDMITKINEKFKIMENNLNLSINALNESSNKIKSMEESVIFYREMISFMIRNFRSNCKNCDEYED